DADVAYDTACENQVEHGEGYFRLLTDYCDDDSFNQDIKIGRIRNPFSVYMDPTIQDPCGADAKWCFITQDITKPEYEQQYPDATPISTLQSMFGTGDTGISAWLNEDVVRIAEYFRIETKHKKLNLYDTGDSLFSDDPRSELLKLQGAQVIKSRDVDAKVVKWIKTNGYDILEEQDWPGKYIPVIRVIGNEYEIEGRIHISGIVRNAKDPQRMYNYWVSQEAEMLALAPKAPFIGYGGQFEGYEDKWKTANVVNYPYLEVNPDVTDAAGTPLPLPQRAMPPMPQAGLIQAKMGASDDIKATTGQYDPSLGAKSNETSGKAILARERQADTGTYHYVDNLARAVRFATRQIIDLIPKIYDTRRIARIIGVDGEVSQATLDPTAPQAMVEIKNELGKVIERIYNPNIGKYDVMVTTGPSYMTKRQEAMNAMAQLLQGNPQLWQVAGDLFIKNMDWPGAEEMAKRFSNTIPPQIKQDEEEQQGQIPPQVQQAIQMAQQHIMQQDQVIAELQKKAEGKEEEERHKDLDLQIKAYQAETDRMAKLAPAITAEQVQALVVQTMQQMLAQ
ncbi:MAG TPA: portal protein, partial [Candidatus Paceibacterota bacterium]